MTVDPLLETMERVRAETLAAHQTVYRGHGSLSYSCACGEAFSNGGAYLVHLTAVTHAAQLAAIRPLIEAEVYRYGERVCRCAEDKAIMATHADRLEAGQ